MDSPVEVATDRLVGSLLDGRYRLDRPLARGGMATVYLATDTRLDREVAVKVMRPALADDPSFVQRFAGEARAAARLSRPEVVAVHDQGTDAATGTAYLVMEYIAGRTLRDVIRQRGALPAAEALDLLEPVLRALAAAHAAGLVHRDIKPENVLLGHDGQVKVADFGLARAVQAAHLTATTTFVGTVAYLSPEQVERGDATERSDVYSAGILLWELLTGSQPYDADSPLSIAYQHVNADVPPPSQVQPGVPPAVDDLVVRATRRDPEARPADAGAFLAELRAVREDLGSDQTTVLTRRRTTAPTLVVRRPDPPSTRTPPPPGPSARRPRRRWIVGLVVAVLALLALGGGWYLGSGRYTSTPPVLDLTQQAAVTRITQAGLHATFAAPAFSETVAAGHVLSQRPGPRASVRRNGTVTLVLSKGPDRRAVPSLVGSTRDAAVAALGAVGLRVGTVTEQFSSAAAGTVIASDPTVGARLRPGTAVALVLSKGVEQLPVPDVRGRPQDAATAALTAAGFTVQATSVFSDTVPAGTVADQSPSTGTAARGSTVTLQVSKGPQLIAVPDLRNQHRDAAVARLEALGLTSRVISIPGPGVVRDQTPGPGTQVRKGTRVTLYVF